MRKNLSIALVTLTLATTPAWACGIGDPTLLLWLLVAAVVAFRIFSLISLTPAFLLAAKSHHPDRWWGFLMGLGLAPYVAWNFGPMLPWDHHGMSLLGLLALTSGAGVLPGLALRRLRPH